MARAPRPGKVAPGDIGDDDLCITVLVDDVAYPLWPTLLGATGARAVRAQIGMSPRQLFELTNDDPDLDLVAGLQWISRCQAGEDVTYDEVLAELTYDAKLGLEVGPKAVPEDHPLS